MTGQEMVAEIAREYGLTVEQVKMTRNHRATVAALYEIVRRMGEAGFPPARIAQATNRSKKVIYGVRGGRGRVSWETWSQDKRPPALRKGRTVYVQGPYWQGLVERSSLTGTHISTLVNRAVAKMLESA